MTLNAMRIAAALEREQALAQELLRRKKARPRDRARRHAGSAAELSGQGQVGAGGRRGAIGGDWGGDGGRCELSSRASRLRPVAA